MAVSVRGIFRPASIALLVALCGSLIIDVSHPNMVHAGTVGNPSNLDVFEADSSIQSSWWGGGALTVSQRFGCTDQIVEPPAPTGWCPSSPSPYTHWHQGIDMPLPTTAIYSQFEGSVVDVEYAILGIRTSAGSLIYLLHGTPAAGYGTVGATVHLGAHVYDTDSLIPLGGSCIPAGSCAHLHFETRQSSSDVPYSTRPFDDVNPEPWLVPQLTARSAMGAMAAMDYSSGNQAFYTFATRPVDGHLKLNFYSASAGWTWLDENSPAVSANPPSVALGGRVAQISFLDNGGVLRQYVFVGGTNGHLYADFYSTTGWRWTDQSSLTGAPAFVREVVGAGTYIESGGARDLFVYVIDSVGALWQNSGYSSTGAPQNWANLSTLATPYPLGAFSLPSLSAGVGATAGVTTTGTHALYAFARGSDGHLYLFVWSDQSGTWLVIDEHIETQFPGVTIGGRVGVDSFVDDNSLLRVYAFVIGTLGRVYDNYYDGTGVTGWHWSDQGLPNAQGISASVGVGVTHFRQSGGALDVYAAAIGTDNIVYLNAQDLNQNASWGATPVYPGLTPYTDVGTTAFVSPSNGSQGLYIMTTATVAWSNVERDLQLDLWSSSASPSWQALDQGSL